MRRRDKGGESGSRPTYSNLGSRMLELLRLAEEQREEIIAEARQEAAKIVDEARKQAEEILANARAQAGKLGDDAMTEPDAGQGLGFETDVNPGAAHNVAE
jgi:cell division septum initiation protein DivIVA